MEPVARASLFHRIALSLLTEDHDNFFCIADSPRLAGCVREVVWLALGCHTRCPAAGILCTLGIDEDDEALETRQFTRWELGLYWEELLPFSNSPLIEKADFASMFSAAIRKMPCLSSISYQYMPGERVVAHFPSSAGKHRGWPVTVASLRIGSVTRRRPSLMEHCIFTRILLPYVASKGLNRIVFNEGLQPIPFFRYLSDSSHTHRLTSITLMLNLDQRNRSLKLAGIFLMEARALRELEITFLGLAGSRPWKRDRGWKPNRDDVEAYRYDDNRGIREDEGEDEGDDDNDDDEEAERDEYDNSDENDDNYDGSDIHHQESHDNDSKVEGATRQLLGYAYHTGKAPVWPFLRRLTLTQVHMQERHLLSLIHRHASTLCALTLGEYGVYPCTLRKMAAIPNLRLTSIRLFCESVKPQCTDLFLLRYLNNEFKSNVISDYSESIPLTTHMCASPEEHRLLRDNSIGNESGLCGGAVTDEATPFLSLDGSTNQEKGYPDEDTNGDAGQDSVSDDESDTGSIDSQDARVAEAPRWKYGRFFSQQEIEAHLGGIYCWPVPEGEPGGYPTWAWEFSHNGDLAYGTEPLSFFEEWDSKVDTATPLPDSAELEFFCSTAKRAKCIKCNASCVRCIGVFLGSTTELLWRVPLPKGAVRLFRLDNDSGFESARDVAQAIRDMHIQSDIQTDETWPEGSTMGITSLDRTPELRPVRNPIRVLNDQQNQGPKLDVRPRWKWGLFFSQGAEVRTNVYYWQSMSDEHGGSPTEVWRFVQGEHVSYGRQLDVGKGHAEPTPFCSAVNAFVNDRRRYCECEECTCLLDTLGYTTSLLPLLKPPEGAVLYTMSDDPFNMVGVKWIEDNDVE